MNGMSSGSVDVELVWSIKKVRHIFYSHLKKAGIYLAC